MASAQAPASLPPGWQGFWPLIARPVLGAMRDRGPLTFNEVVHIIRFQAIHADLVSGHNNGPDWGARNLAQVVLEDAAEIIVVTDDGRYMVPADVTGYLSPWKQVTYKLLTIEEAAAAAAHAATERPVLHWVDRRMYDPHGGKWIDGRLPGRKYGPEDVAEMVDVIVVARLAAGRADRQGPARRDDQRAPARRRPGVAGDRPRHGHRPDERRAVRRDPFVRQRRRPAPVRVDGELVIVVGGDPQGDRQTGARRSAVDVGGSADGARPDRRTDVAADQRWRAAAPTSSHRSSR